MPLPRKTIRRRLPTALPVLLAVSAIALAACGGSPASSSTSTTHSSSSAHHKFHNHKAGY